MMPANTRIGRYCGDDDACASDEEIEAIARERVERARVDLLLDHPYFAAALLSIPMRGTSEQSIPQALVTDGLRIVYRHDLVARMERPKVRMLMMHALLHVLLQHPERGLHRDWVMWTSACDIAVDLLFIQLGIEQASGREFLRRFEGLSAEGIYAVLQRDFDPSAPPAPAPGDGMLPPPPTEEHERIESAERRSERQAFERAMVGAQPPTPAQLDGLKRGFREAAVEQGARIAGSGSGGGSAEIDAAALEQVCWRQLLARFMREPIDREWSFSRPNRKHLWRGLYLPGPVDREGGRFVLAIDTSGSMSDRDLRLVLAEVDAIRRSCACELTVLQFDAAIHAKAEFSRWSEEDGTIGSTRVMRVFGRGGTDLRLPFVWVEEEQRKGRRISALIVCTDGWGPLPAEPPTGLPVLFMLTPNHQAPKFGEHVLLAQAPELARGHRDQGTNATAGSGVIGSQAAGAVTTPRATPLNQSVPRSAFGRMI